MKVCLKYNKTQFNEHEVEIVKNFIEYLQSLVPLKKDLTVTFTNQRKGVMTTGVRLPKSQIFVLANGRILIDILRTLSHEWVHEFQHQKMGVKDDEPTEDIGGPIENLANILSGIIMKKFQKNRPDFVPYIYGEN